MSDEQPALTEAEVRAVQDAVQLALIDVGAVGAHYILFAVDRRVPRAFIVSNINKSRREMAELIDTIADTMRREGGVAFEQTLPIRKP